MSSREGQGGGETGQPIDQLEVVVAADKRAADHEGLPHHRAP